MTFVFLALLVWRIDVSATGRALGDAVLGWLLLAAFATSLQVVMSVFKWEILIRSLGLRASIRALTAYYLAGVSVSALLPGSVGGDVLRWRMLTRHWGRSVEAAATILGERGIGIVVMILSAFAAVLIEPRLATLPVLSLLLGLGLAIGLGITLPLNRRLAAGLAYRTRRSFIRHILRPLYRLHRALRRFGPSAVLGSSVYALLFYLAGALAYFCVLRSLGTDLGYREAFAAQILRNVLLLLPISIGGLGLVQAGDVYVLGRLGVDPATALAVSVIRHLLHYLWAFVGGGLLWAWSPVGEAAPTDADESPGRLRSTLPGGPSP